MENMENIENMEDVNIMKKSKILLLVSILIASFTLSSCYCRNDKLILVNRDHDLPIPDIQSYENGIKAVNEYISCPIEDEFIEKYPYIEGYYGYNLENPFVIESYPISIFNIINIKIPRLSMDIDERLLLYFQYDNETYKYAKEYLMETLFLSEYPAKEYNGYIFYDRFNHSSDKNSPQKFSYFVCNDSKGTVIILELYYSIDDVSLYQDKYEWGKYMDVVYGQWYDFSQ